MVGVGLVRRLASECCFAAVSHLALFADDEVDARVVAECVPVCLFVDGVASSRLPTKHLTIRCDGLNAMQNRMDRKAS